MAVTTYDQTGAASSKIALHKYATSLLDTQANMVKNEQQRLSTDSTVLLEKQV